MNITDRSLRFRIQAGLIATGFILLFFRTLSGLVSDWSSDPNFSHGFLIPVISLYMVWYKKDQLRQIPNQPSRIGLGIIILGLLVHVAANIGAELFMMRFSMVITLSGIIIYALGIPMFKAMLIPVAYLMMMIPIPAILWNQVAFPLQLLAAKLSAQMIALIGIPVFREGNILHLATTSLEVVDACSGLRSLTSLLALTGICAFLAPLCVVKKWILFLSAIPIAVAVNVIRLTITAAMAVWINPETAHGFLHDMSGLIIFGAALVLVYLVFIIELTIENKQTGKHA
ncbi:MAG: exosortase/archaeosortase family protein [Desulfotignum sp.]|nr:exosortase/archaeosortase family protein [Desulfotignum sp.]MCF8112363.1 exosortase/archaeosortase family protein [Desulfotignum sp.]MCF8124599.1 exosortase/archaeosortase family protein [Desulfotignum sp.]